jgi:chemotaxis protein methyltransferase CheR
MNMLMQPSPFSAAGAAFGEADFTWFQRRVESKTRIRFGEYKSDQMRRRIADLAQKSECVSFVSYASLIERDPRKLLEFLDRMTINVTELLRNPNRFEELTELVLPEILARKKGQPLSIWSAGCSYGAEAYTVAMLLQEIDPEGRHRIKGTDIDLNMIAMAKRPCFSVADMANISESRRQLYFEECAGTWLPKESLQNMTSFGPQDLLAGPYPKETYDLVLCRNVVIYFTDKAKERIYRGFFNSLRPGGVLFVGGTERLTNHREIGFDLQRPFFYKKP